MDQQQAEQKVVETETTQTPSPEVEKPITGAETGVKESDDQGSVTKKSDVSDVMTEEQRRAFQEMRLENKWLKEVMESRTDEGSAFDVFKTQAPPVAAPGPIDVRNFTDTVTGDTNWQAYNQAVQQREQRLLSQARFEAQQTVREEIDEQRARSKYPELFADKNTEKLIAAQWFFEKAQGNNASITQIAEGFARNFKQAVSKAEKIGEERALDEVTEKEKAGLSAQSQTQAEARSEASAEEEAHLSYQTRRGNDDAIASRISKIPWANK
jgi:hypothetical protein